jgi:hypothetical protein
MTEDIVQHQNRLKQFQARVSWADDCSIEWAGTWPYISVDGCADFLMSYQDVDRFLDQLAELKPHIPQAEHVGVVLDGDCSQLECDRINHVLGKMGIIVYWLGISQSIWTNRWILSVTDGVDLSEKFPGSVVVNSGHGLPVEIPGNQEFYELPTHMPDYWVSRTALEDGGFSFILGESYLGSVVSHGFAANEKEGFFVLAMMLAGATRLEAMI